MKKFITICVVMTMLLTVNNAGANTTDSSTMWFEGDLSYNDAYTGTIAMVDEADVGIGDGISGFDVYAKEGGTAYVTNYYGATGGAVGSYMIGSDHDAYSQAGPWGSWYDPDVADWQQYSLELTSDHWYLRYTSTGESPMSGNLVWTSYDPTTGTAIGYAYETDLGTQYGGHDGGSAAYGGGAGYWDWDCGWGVEVIPLQYSAFKVTIYDISESYMVSLTPLIPAPGAILLGGIGVGLVGWLRRKRTL